MARPFKVTKTPGAAAHVRERQPAFSKDMLHDNTVLFESGRFTQANFIGSQNDAFLARNAPRDMEYITGAPRAATGGLAGASGVAVGTKDAGANRGATRAATATGKGAGAAAKGAAAVKGAGGAAGKAGAKGLLSTASNADYQEAKRDDLGVSAIDRTQRGLIVAKDTAMLAKSGVKTGYKVTKTAVKETQRAAKYTVRGTKAVVRTTARAAQVTARAIVAAVRGIAHAVAAIAANPVTLVIAIVLLLLIALLVGVMATVNMTPKNIMGEALYTQLRTYTMDKDRELIQAFEDYEKQPEFEDIAEDDVTKEMEVVPATSFKLMGAYLVALYDTTLTYDVAVAEIDRIHELLYTIREEIENETEEKDVPVLDEAGQPVLDAEGRPVMETITEERRTLTVTLEGQTLKEYFEANLATLLTPQQKTYYDFLLWTSSLWMDGLFGPPFEAPNWFSYKTDAYGPRIHPITGKPDFHRGLDIGMPAGTPILNVISGTVVEVSNHYSWGLNVVVESEDGTYRVRYAHMSAISVANGEQIAAGEVVGAVGATGEVKGAHLHIEVEETGELINPEEVLPIDE